MLLVLRIILVGKMQFVFLNRTLRRAIAIIIRVIFGPRKKQLPVLRSLRYEQMQSVLNVIVVGKMQFVFLDRTLRWAININISIIVLNIVMVYSSRCTDTTTA
jgi:hypothetical protein